MATLKIVIKAEWFDEIASGKKTIEYRDVTPFWTSRLFDENGKRRAYEKIEFINGYNTDARRMIVEYLGFTTRNNTYLYKGGEDIEEAFPEVRFFSSRRDGEKERRGGFWAS